ncbi:MAG: hypothetical protein HC828_10120, partial [Blastochloris sp.]|nr:hypothetical protein [Blastochloris sp.]
FGRLYHLLHHVAQAHRGDGKALLSDGDQPQRSQRLQRLLQRRNRAFADNGQRFERGIAAASAQQRRQHGAFVGLQKTSSTRNARTSGPELAGKRANSSSSAARRAASPPTERASNSSGSGR